MLKNLRPALRAFLLGDPTISAAVIGERIFYSTLPSGTQTSPAIVFNVISEDTDYHMQGPSGLVTARYQIDAWAASRDAAHSLALAIKDRMSGFRGVMGEGEGAVDVLAVFSESARTAYDTETQLQNASRDFFITYREQ